VVLPWVHIVSITFAIYVFSADKDVEKTGKDVGYPRQRYWGIIEESSGFFIVLNHMPIGMTAIRSINNILDYCLYKILHINHIAFFSLCDSLPDTFEVGK